MLGLALLALAPRDRARGAQRAPHAGPGRARRGRRATAEDPANGAQVAIEVAVLVVGLVLVRLVAMLLFRVVLAAAGAAPPRIVGDLTTATGFLLWGFAWLRLAGVDLTSLMTGSAIVTAAVAFSMQDTLGNVLGGVLLQLDDSIHEGDWLRVDEYSGRVAQVRWRHTTLETPNGERVVLPNAWLLKNRFAVAGSAGAAAMLRRWVRLSVDLGASPGDVCRVLAEAVANAEISNVEARPACDVVVMEVGPRSASYAIRYWLRDPWHADATDSAVRIHAIAALARNGMKLGAPYQEQFWIRDDEEQRHAAQAADSERRVRALASVDLFAPLSDAERANARPAPALRAVRGGRRDDAAGRGRALALPHHLGQCRRARRRPRGPHALGELGPGSLFGEMGLLTGAPRRATVTARTDVICYRLDKAGFETIVRGRPDIAEAISRVLAERNQRTEGQLAAAHAADRAMHHDDILEKVRRFFALA